MWGDREILLKEITQFMIKNESVISALKGSLDIPDWHVIQSQLHTFKGLSGNLALTQLSQLFNDAERSAMRASVNDIAKVFNAIEQALDVIKGYLAEQNSPVNTAVVSEQNAILSTAQLLELVEVLLKSAQNNEYNEDAAAALVTGANEVSQKTCQRIQNALDDFEFEQAICELEQLKAQTISSAIDQ